METINNHRSSEGSASTLARHKPTKPERTKAPVVKLDAATVQYEKEELALHSELHKASGTLQTSQSTSQHNPEFNPSMPSPSTSKGDVEELTVGGGANSELACVAGDPIYTYDVLGRRESMTSPAGTDSDLNRLTDISSSFTWQYNELNQLLEDSEARYQYDLDGNMTLKISKATGDSTKYTWSIENKLIKVEMPNGDVV